MQEMIGNDFTELMPALSQLEITQLIIVSYMIIGISYTVTIAILHV